MKGQNEKGLKNQSQLDVLKEIEDELTKKKNDPKNYTGKCNIYKFLMYFCNDNEASCWTFLEDMGKRLYWKR